MHKLISLFFLSLISCFGVQSFDQRSKSIKVGNAELYAHIQSLVNCYQRPFTLLDIDADRGYFALRVAREYDAVCVMTESNKALLDLCETHKELSNIVLLNTHFTSEKLQHLSECEHFDVVLALRFVDEYAGEWQEAIKVLLMLGDHIILCAPKHMNIEEFIVASGGKILSTLPLNDVESTYLYTIQMPNRYLRRKTWLRCPMQKDLYLIESTFTHKQLIKPSSWPSGSMVASEWVPGINLCTFKMCNGTYPTSEQLKTSLDFMYNTSHTDWVMNNMIVQGTKIALIDCDDPSSKRFFSDALLQAHQEMLDLSDTSKIEHYFWHKLIRVPVSARQTVKLFNRLFPPNSLVFDIGSHDKILMERYLEYGARLVCCGFESEFVELNSFDGALAQVPLLKDSFAGEGANGALDSLFAWYGVPAFCNIHVPVESTYACLKTLSRSVACIAFKFDVRFRGELLVCLNHLLSLGYSKFNFSARAIPNLILEDNLYIGTRKDWASSIDALMHEIDEFAKLDHDGDRFWGYVYAR